MLAAVRERSQDARFLSRPQADLSLSVSGYHSTSQLAVTSSCVLEVNMSLFSRA